jgi:uncharacterized protein (TIGR02996 family)
VEPLLEAIAQRPDDLATWSVYADLLQSQGDPRGELVSLMLKREQTPTQQLFEMQRRYLKRHERTLIQRPSEVLRRGFVTEMRIESPSELERLDQPALRLVDNVTLAIDGADWDEWCTALATSRPWRWLTVEFSALPEALALAPLFSPTLEHVRMKFDAAVELDWSTVAAPALQRLVLVDAGHIEAIAEFPALRELWLLGETEPDDALLETWAALERIVVTGDSDAPNAIAHSPTWNPDDDYETNAFFLLEGEVDLAMVQKLVARMSGIDSASVRIGTLWWQRRPVSVVQMYGQQNGAMLPFGLALGLYNLTGQPPIALIETFGGQAQYLVLGELLARDTIDPSELTTSLVRRAFDLAFGCDPGTAILDDILDCLAVAETHDLVTTFRTDTILTLIDPDAAELDDENDDDDEDREDEEEDYTEYEDQELAAYEEPIPLEKAIVKTDDHAMIEADLELEAAEQADPEAVVDEEPAELDTEEVSDRPEVWYEFRDNWELRATDPDDESGEVRWPDPEVVAHAAEDVELAVAQPACETHGTLFETCSSCNGLTCQECETPRIEGMCGSCVSELEQAKPLPEPHTHHGRVVD